LREARLREEERGLGTKAAKCCINSSGDIASCVVPSCQGVFSFSMTCLAALHCTALHCTRSLPPPGG